MTIAFGIKSSRQIVGLPGWTDGSRFDILAKLDDSAASEIAKLTRAEQIEDRKLMIQQILTDRFSLKSHQEKREVPAYALVVAKGGEKLKRSEPGVASGGGSKDYHPNSISMKEGELTGQAIGIDLLAHTLSEKVNREVIDQTGLTEKYDLVLKWSPDQASDYVQESSPENSGPSIFTAVQEQLGMKLEPTRALVNILVVDQMKKPTEN